MVSRSSPSALILMWPLAALAAGCGSKDSVTLSGEIREAMLTLEQRALGTFVSAELDLFLELGAYAEGTASVQRATFSLVESESQAQLGAALEMTTDRPLPLEVAKGTTVTAHFTTGAATEPVGTALRDELCAGTLALRGEVRYALDGDQVLDVRSPPFTPDGC